VRDQEYGRGHIEVVDVKPHRAALNGDHAIGATTLSLIVNEAVYSETGGIVDINGIRYTYTAYDDGDEDEDVFPTLTLPSPGLTVAAADDDWVSVWDPLYNTIKTTKAARVRLLGATDNDDTIRAEFAQQLLDKLGGGIRGTVGEECLLELDNTTWRIIEIFGLDDPDTGPGDRSAEDSMTVTATGAQTFILTHEPISPSEILTWHPAGGAGVVQKSASWSRSGNVITIADADGFVAVDDVFVCEYRYRKGALSGGSPFEDSGWKYLSIAASDSTNRSAPGFDDSAWSVDSAPFGDVAAPFNYIPGLDWPAPVNTSAYPKTTPQKALWMRRWVPCLVGGAATVTVRVDNIASIYWNGVLLGSTPTSPILEYQFTVPASSVKANNLVAVRVENTGSGDSADHTYADLRVSQ
jgi:hypothetical protein